MITLSKKLYVIFISSLLFFGIQAMKFNDKEKTNLAKLKKKLYETCPDIEKLSGSELLTNTIDQLITDATLDFLVMEDDILNTLPMIIQVFTPIYQNLTPASKKFLAEIINEAIAVMNKKITESKNEFEKKKLQKIITDAKPIVEFIKNNSDAGIVAQFSLLDLSGKIIVGASLPLALYGCYKAAQAIMNKDEKEEALQ